MRDNTPHTEPDDSLVKRWLGFNTPGFALPHGYFEEMLQSIRWRLGLDEMHDSSAQFPKGSPFLKPNLEPQDFVATVLDAVKANEERMEHESTAFERSVLGQQLKTSGAGFTSEKTIVQHRSIHYVRIGIWSAAASLLIGWGMWTWLNRPSSQPTPMPVAHFEQAVDSLSESDILEILEVVDVPADQLAELDEPLTSRNNVQRDSDSSQRHSSHVSSMQPGDDEVEQFLLDQADESLLESF